MDNCTFIIPIKIEHPDRYRNAKIVLGALNSYFKTNVFIYETSEDGFSKLDFLKDLGNLKIKHWVEKDDEVFHRTKYLNIMLDEVNTPVVANYDIDVLIHKNFYKQIVDAIALKEVDVVYPYKFGNNGQIMVLEKFNYRDFENSGYDLKTIHDSGNYIEYCSEYGHCIFFNTEIYKSHGAENENFISYGPEDKERGERFKKMGFRVNWVSNSKIYHFEHYRGPDSSNNNPMINKNWEIFNNIQKMDKDSILEYYSKLEYNSKYKTIGK
jgi:hypothetical protein